LQRGSVVNLPFFPDSLAAKASPRTRPGISGYTPAVQGVRICDTLMPLQLRGNHGGSAACAGAISGPDIAKLSPASSTPSAIGFQMTDFQRKLFSQETGCEPSVLFGTAGLPGLYPFATARTNDRTGIQRRVLARQVEPR
jgi:hypothetical protein